MAVLNMAQLLYCFNYDLGFLHHSFMNKKKKGGHTAEKWQAGYIPQPKSRYLQAIYLNCPYNHTREQYTFKSYFTSKIED